MFEGFSQNTIDFMWGIRFNNERGWFLDHKQDYLDHLYRPMQELCRQVYEADEAEYLRRGMVRKVSRIYRDARRLHGRGPYKDHLWMSVEQPTNRFAAHPTLWFELEPEGWSCGLGYYAARPITMAKLRARMDRDPSVMLRLLRRLEGQDRFVLDGPAYKKEKTAPDPRLTPWYNKKSFTLIHTEPLTEELYSPGLADRLAEDFRFLLPFHDYFATLDSDPPPPGWEG